MKVRVKKHLRPIGAVKFIELVVYSGLVSLGLGRASRFTPLRGWLPVGATPGG